MEEKENNFLEQLSPYEKWYAQSRCIYCGCDREVIVDKTGEVKKIKRKGGLGIEPMYPSYTSNLCYYHRKEKEGKFKNEATGQAFLSHKVLKGSHRS